MSLKKKILATAIFPILILGFLSMILTLTVVKNAMVNEIRDALKGTAAATLAAYDQNTGDYIESTNGDIWKGGYNVSHSDSLVDKIKDNSGMDVTFFYGDKRIMTSALDTNGNRILGSPAGEKIVEKVLRGEEEYFSKAVSLDGVLTYGYYMPVYQNATTTEPIGMIFVGSNKAVQDAAINRLLRLVGIAVLVVMVLCIVAASRIAASISRNIQSSIGIVKTVAEGKLDVEIGEKMLSYKDETGELSRAMLTLRDALKSTIQEIAGNANHLLEASETLGNVAERTGGAMQEVTQAVNRISESSTEQAENSRNTSEHMRIMGSDITETASEVGMLDTNAAAMQRSSEKAMDTLANLRQINDEVERFIEEIRMQTNRTNDSVQQIYKATAVITSIAEETNLLSLNASIEAARAGESGRGFAVVADQIQKLADQSSSSSFEIEETSRKLMEDSAKAVEIMQQMQGIITSQSESMQDTQSVVREVLGEINDSMHGIEMIKGSAQRLEQSRNEVVRAVEELSEIAQDNASGTQRTYDATQEAAGAFEQVSNSAGRLREIADELVKSIEYFKL
ncbi:MAG: methyl-accepting chemotaxis protein [Lachnospiraceae bacterium]|nr:methyl-accepting chemotaxis protein [Lachnospiraceae bacterium]